jgi:chromosome segregation ATPase
VTINSRQHRTVSALLASLQQTAARGSERLQRLERVLATIAADAAEPERVRSTYATVSALGRELLELQQSNAEFAAALEAVGTRGELADVKRRLEGHQALLGAWEERVRRALEDVTELQSPSRRNSMLLSAPPATRGAGLQAGTLRRAAFTPGPSLLRGDGSR